MPCTVTGPFTDQEEGYPKAKGAALCGIATVLETSNLLDQVLNAMDWREAGITKALFLAWWDEHKRQDAQRHAREAQHRAEQERRQAAFAKLTPEERSALGLN